MALLELGGAELRRIIELAELHELQDATRIARLHAPAFPRQRVPHSCLHTRCAAWLLCSGRSAILLAAQRPWQSRLRGRRPVAPRYLQSSPQDFERYEYTCEGMCAGVQCDGARASGTRPGLQDCGRVSNAAAMHASARTERCRLSSDERAGATAVEQGRRRAWLRVGLVLGHFGGESSSCRHTSFQPSTRAAREHAHQPKHHHQWLRHNVMSAYARVGGDVPSSCSTASSWLSWRCKPLSTGWVAKSAPSHHHSSSETSLSLASESDSSASSA